MLRLDLMDAFIFPGKNILRMEAVRKSTLKLLRIETTHLLFSPASSFCSFGRLAMNALRELVSLGLAFLRTQQVWQTWSAEAIA